MSRHKNLLQLACHTFCFRKLSGHKSLCHNKNFYLQLYFVTTKFSMSQHSFYGYSTTSSRQSFRLSQHNFFSDPCRWQNCLLQHRNIFCNKLVLAQFFFIFYRGRILLLCNFIVGTEKFFVPTEILTSFLHYFVT